MACLLEPIEGRVSQPSDNASPNIVVTPPEAASPIIPRISFTWPSVQKASGLCRLIIFKLQPPEILKVSEAVLEGCDSAELLCVNESGKYILAASNDNTSLAVFTLNNNALTKCHQIRLLDDERPVGTCCFENQVLLMTAKALTPQNDYEPDYNLKLSCKAFCPVTTSSGCFARHFGSNRYKKELQLPKEKSRVSLLSMNRHGEKANDQRSELTIGQHSESATNQRSEAMINQHFKAANNQHSSLNHQTEADISLHPEVTGIHHPEVGVNRPSENMNQNQDEQNFVIDLDKSFSSSGYVGVHEEEENDVHGSNGSDAISQSPSLISLYSGIIHGLSPREIRERYNHQLEANANVKHQQEVKHQHDRPQKPSSQMTQQMNQICETLQRVEDKLTSHLQYALGCHPAGESQVVHLVWSSPRYPSVKKTFILDNGLLKLDLVQRAFGITYVEILIDGKAFVACANTEGYIPMKFTPNAVFHILGHRHSTMEHKVTQC